MPEQRQGTRAVIRQADCDWGPVTAKSEKSVWPGLHRRILNRRQESKIIILVKTRFYSGSANEDDNIENPQVNSRSTNAGRAC